MRKGIGGDFTPGSAGTFGWGGAAGTWFFVDPKEALVGLFFTHVPERFEKLAYEALV